MTLAETVDSFRSEVVAAAATIVRRRRALRANRALLVAVSGIDETGDEQVAQAVVERLRAQGLRAERLSVDSAGRTTGRLALDAIVGRALLPLRETRSARLPAVASAPMVEFDDIDVLVVDGAMLLRRELRALFDLSIWVECSFATAQERSPTWASSVDALAAWARQKEHLRRDEPRLHADLVIVHDPRLQAPAWSEVG
ncbi:MAG: hypothetical protein IPK26_07760 [Planctomycetes bacterium]|nr:hypothetical protein [Planctomycetota bacterium]